ncbi:MAG: WGR domain-containing protein, partial [Myxococcales bacterium]|nr:WGR domain-containing protein [Myxococcales bacterium]
MRRFELVDGSASKFWEIAQEGETYTVRYGRLGTSGKTQTKDLGDVVKAAEAVAKLIAEKTKKGYAEVETATSKRAPVTPRVIATPSTEAVAETPVERTSEEALAERTLADPGVPSAALLALAMPTRRYPHAGPESWLGASGERVLEEHGLVGIVEALGMSRGMHPVPLARAFATASGETFAAARASAARELTSLRSNSSRWVSEDVGLLAWLTLQDDPAALADVVKWLHECREHAGPNHALPLLSFLPDRDLWSRLLRTAFKEGFDRNVDPATALCHLGAWVIPELSKLLQRGSRDARQKVFDALAASDAPEAAVSIVEHGDERMARAGVERLLADPPRAARAALTLVTRTTKRTFARDLLERLLRGDPSLASVATTDPQRAVIDAIEAERRGPTASELPEVLAKGPWEGRKVAKPVVVAGLVAPDEPATEVWPEGLREKWSDLRWNSWSSYEPAYREVQLLRVFTGVDGDLSPERAVAKLRGKQNRRWVLEHGGANLPFLRREHALAFWTSVHPAAWKLSELATRGVVATLGVDALEGLLVRAGVEPAPKRDYVGEARRGASLPRDLDALLPIRSPRIAPAAALGMLHRGARKAASAWVLAHPETAAKGLIPLALAKPGKSRTGAEEALRLLAREGHDVVVHAVAASFGAEAAAGVRAVLSIDPFALAKPPKLPAWLDLSLLAPLRNANGERFPASVTEAVVGALCASALDRAYTGFEAQREHLDETTLDELAWSLFRAWDLAGGPSKDAWAFTALAHAGGERCVARLSPLIAGWPTDGLAARAQTGVEILGTVGSDAALVALHRFSEKAKTKKLKSVALETMEEIAEARGLSADELADRLVPDLGLDEAGTLELDLGERVLFVGFDEHLVPFVRDEEG